MSKQTKIPLGEVACRININDYSTQEYADFLRSFESFSFCIRFIENDAENELTIKADASQLSHLTGFQYAYGNGRGKKSFRGKKALDTLSEMSWGDIKYNINKNKVVIGPGKVLDWNSDILPRFEYLPFALNTICKKYSLKKQETDESQRLVKTVMKGEYFYFKCENNDYLIFSLKSTGKTYILESFIVNDGLRMLGVLETLDIIEVVLK